MENGSAASRYAVLETKRSAYLERARKCSELTLPHLFPPDGTNEAQQFLTPYQGLGARGVNNLSSKLLLSLLPPNASFFKMSLSENEIDNLQAMSGDQFKSVRTEIDKGLSKIEKRFMSWTEGVAVRPDVNEALKHLIVGGNVLSVVDEVDGLRNFRLDKYVVRRSPSGVVLEIVIKEPVDYDDLDPEIQGLIENVPSSSQAPAAECHLYTHVKYVGKKYEVYQEIKGKIVPESQGSYLQNELPFLALRFTKVAGEDYGRSYVEEYYGDLKSLEGLTKAVVNSAAIVSKAIVMVRPGGVTSSKKVAEAETGDVITGSMEDIGLLQFDKWADLRIAFEAIKTLEQRLAFAFLLNTAIQRPGDRVTAEEIRYMARELEDALGGTYSVLSQDFQMPFLLAGLAMLRRTSNKEWRIPKLPAGINPVIVTGLEALGRGHDLQKLDLWLSGAAQVLGPEVMKRVNTEEYLARRALALGVDIQGLMISQEQLDQEAQQAQMMEMANRLGPNAITQMGGMAKQGMAQQADPNAPPAPPQG
jgi:hypothetical protein